jgi:hypothetical protein
MSIYEIGKPGKASDEGKARFLKGLASTRKGWEKQVNPLLPRGIISEVLPKLLSKLYPEQPR